MVRIWMAALTLMLVFPSPSLAAIQQDDWGGWGDLSAWIEVGDGSQQQTLALKTAFLGFFKGARDEKITDPGTRAIYNAMFKRLKAGEQRTFRYFDGLRQTKRGQTFFDEAHQFEFFTPRYAGASYKSMGRVQKGFGDAKGHIPTRNLGFFFVTLDDTVVLEVIHSDGMKKIYLYTLISYHLYDFANRHITYSGHAVIPFSASFNKGDKHWNNAKKAFVHLINTNQQMKEGFANLVKQLASGAVKGRRLLATLKNKSAQRRDMMGIVRVGSKLMAPVGKNSGVQNKYRVALGNPNSFRQLAGYLLTSHMARTVPMVPVYADRRSDGLSQSYIADEPALREIFLQKRTRNLFSALTGKRIDAAKGQALLDESSDFYALGDNLFPMPLVELRLDAHLSLSQKRIAQDDIEQTDRFTVHMKTALTQYKQSIAGQHYAFCPPAKLRNKTTASFSDTNDYIPDEATKISDIQYYNALFRAITRIYYKLPIIGPYTNRKGVTKDGLFGNLGEDLQASLPTQGSRVGMQIITPEAKSRCR
ncbi:MAG: hypothetical protein HQL53_10745 [Magnetococcales bacterium]|nr:hypothetical protein [Magnetococcales bacterium]